MRQGIGLQGQSYGIPTMQGGIEYCFADEMVKERQKKPNHFKSNLEVIQKNILHSHRFLLLLF